MSETKVKKTKRVLRPKTKPPKPIKKYIWLSGHAITAVFGTIYFFLYFMRAVFKLYWLPRISYRLTFIGVILSYSISTLTTFGGIPNYYTLLSTENCQNLLLSLIWLITRPSVFKVVPYLIITCLQLSLHFNVKPVLNQSQTLTDVIPVTELLVAVALIFDTLLFRGTSGFALLIYLSFYWLRINFSPYTQAFLLKLIKLIDDKVMSKQSEKIKKHWDYIIEFIEFRRSQTLAALKSRVNNGAEPKVVPSSKIDVEEGHVRGKTENYQLAGQTAPDSKYSEQLSSGVKLNELYKQASKPVSAQESKEEAKPQLSKEQLAHLRDNNSSSTSNNMIPAELNQDETVFQKHAKQEHENDKPQAQQNKENQKIIEKAQGKVEDMQ